MPRCLNEGWTWVWSRKAFSLGDKGTPHLVDYFNFASLWLPTSTWKKASYELASFDVATVNDSSPENINGSSYVYNVFNDILKLFGILSSPKQTRSSNEHFLTQFHAQYLFLSASTWIFIRDCFNSPYVFEKYRWLFAILILTYPCN